jgi:hypothetical protein
MPYRNFFDPTPEQQIIVLVDSSVIRRAQNLIAFCQYCDSESSEFPFDLLLDRVTGSDPTRTDYILETPAKCPNCRRDVLEKTLVAPHTL